jgi:hypothetical protein
MWRSVRSKLMHSHLKTHCTGFGGPALQLKAVFSPVFRIQWPLLADGAQSAVTAYTQ